MRFYNNDEEDHCFFLFNAGPCQGRPDCQILMIMNYIVIFNNKIFAHLSYM